MRDADNDLMTGLDFGGMRNISRSVSVGAAVHLEVEDGRNGLGLALRGRRWLGTSISLDVAAGWVFAGDDERGNFLPSATYGEAAVNFQDRFQLAARIESWRWEEFSYWPAFQWEPHRETLVHFGAKVGPIPGVPFFILFLLGTSAGS